MSLDNLYKKYKDQAAFFIVYIREAHPSGPRQSAENVKDKVVFKQPKTQKERAVVAESCLRELNLSLPFLLDDIEDSTEKAYSAWPNRIYVIDLEGKVAMRGPKGAGGITLADAKKALKRVLAATPKDPARAK